MSNAVCEQDPGEESESQAAHAAARVARERQRESNMPLLWRFPLFALRLEGAL